MSRFGNVARQSPGIACHCITMVLAFDGSKTHSSGIKIRAAYHRSWNPLSCGSEISDRNEFGARSTTNRTALFPFGRPGASTTWIRFGVTRSIRYWSFSE